MDIYPEQLAKITDKEIEQMKDWTVLTEQYQNDPNRKKIALITGILGQDGSYLAEFLLEKNYDVVGIYRRSSSPNFSRIAHIKHKIRLVEGDVTDYTSLFQIIHDCCPDEIYNLAAQSHVHTSFKQPFYTNEVNYIGVLNFLEILKRYKCKFYQASTSEMFGSEIETSRGLALGGEPYQDEYTRMTPNSPYAISKLAAHNAVKLYREAYGIHASCGILFNHESPRRGDEFVTKKITDYVRKLKPLIVKTITGDNGEKYTDCHNFHTLGNLKLGNLDAKRDWGYAKDYVEGMWAMLQQEKPDDYVLATGETHTVKEFLTEAFSQIGVKDWESFVEIDNSLKRPSEVPYLCGYADKAKRVLNWVPKTTFKELVRIMLNG